MFPIAHRVLAHIHAGDCPWCIKYHTFSPLTLDPQPIIMKGCTRVAVCVEQSCSVWHMERSAGGARARWAITVSSRIRYHGSHDIARSMYIYDT